jgi:hypothetical protein
LPHNSSDGNDDNKCGKNQKPNDWYNNYNNHLGSPKLSVRFFLLLFIMMYILPVLSMQLLHTN